MHDTVYVVFMFLVLEEYHKVLGEYQFLLKLLFLRNGAGRVPHNNSNSQT